jgi:hypothetical protein
MRSSTKTRAFIAILASAGFLWALTLSVSPQLHERIHRDANRIDHSCAVTFVASGKFNHSASPQLVSDPIVADQFCSIPALTPQWVESPFLSASIFEHAPPALA